MRKRLAVCFVGLLLVLGCATANVSLTHEQGYLWASNVYLAQYDLYLDQVLRPDLPVQDRIAVKKDVRLLRENMLRKDLTPEQKSILQGKKEILMAMDPLLKVWGNYVRSGAFVPVGDYTTIDQVEAAMIALVQRLLK